MTQVCRTSPTRSSQGEFSSACSKISDLELKFTDLPCCPTVTAGIEKALKLVQSFSQVAEVIVASTPEEIAQWTTAKDQANIGKSTLPMPEIPVIGSRSGDPCGLSHRLRLGLFEVQHDTDVGCLESEGRWLTWNPAARRFFRLFKWIDCWTTSYNLFQAYTGPKRVARDGKGRNISQPRKDTDGDSVRVFLTITKLSLLGIFLFMEMFCIVSTNHPPYCHQTPGPRMSVLCIGYLDRIQIDTNRRPSTTARPTQCTSRTTAGL